MAILWLLWVVWTLPHGQLYGGQMLSFPSKQVSDQVSIREEISRLNDVLLRFFEKAPSLSNDLLLTVSEYNVLILLVRILFRIETLLTDGVISIEDGTHLKFIVDLFYYLVLEKPLYIKIELDERNIGLVDIILESICDCVENIEDILLEFKSIRFLQN